MFSIRRIVFLFFLFPSALPVLGQSAVLKDNTAGVYVDSKGVLRWKSSNREAAFFGVNYTVPFAYGYRSHKALGVGIEKAIRDDVYHLARLGIDAFRVHVWDTEITDTTGNLLQNEHLRLFDFLIAELKKRNIRILVTPIAFWGNGYPEQDEKTPGFSRKYGKDQSLINEDAIKAQENYLKQFFKHVNPYTRLTYTDDPDVIATEINNEPHHSGPIEAAAQYINRLAAAIRNVGWTKPVFYNISESPYYAGAVAGSDINGVSFQWYPTGLVANHELKGNYLPHVSRYAIPFDTIPAFANKAKMVYEFDAGDVLQPVMYPAMARSFRTAGFQWATQFAYDPMATAYANTEYQTHYLNLAYTPSKAISLLIASKVFHLVPRLRDYGEYPSNNKFGVFKIDYREQLSEMNSPEEFYYSNSTSSKPAAIAQLKKVAGVGNSEVVKYDGSGAYFLDKLDDGIWRLEVMPDALQIRDPFEKASPKKEVTLIRWETHRMSVLLPRLNKGFNLKGINSRNSFDKDVNGTTFNISPGTYIVTAKGKDTLKTDGSTRLGALYLNEFVAPIASGTRVYVKHLPFSEVCAGNAFEIQALVAGIDSNAKVTLHLNQLAGQYKMLEMDRSRPDHYSVRVPADFVVPGLIQYRIIVQSAERFYSFPGNHEGSPFAWDNYINDTWETYVATGQSPLEIFNATRDRQISVFPTWNGDVQTAFVAADQPGQLAWSITTRKLPNEHILAFQFYFADKLAGRSAELPLIKHLVIRARSNSGSNYRVKITLIDSVGEPFSAFAELRKEFSETEIPLSSFKPDSALLLPRPYPGFGALWYKASGLKELVAGQTEKIQVSIGSELKETVPGKIYGAEIQSVYFKK